MAHVELSLSEVFAPDPGTPTELGYDNLGRWAATVSSADEPCLLIDAETRVVAVSAAGCDLLGLGTPEDVMGLPLLDGGLRLLDFTAYRGELAEPDIDKIPPLLALASGRMARGLLRIMATTEGISDATVDAISTPVLADGAVAGSLTFFSGL
ncbi:PAS domain-containing protein [Micromonospora sp. NPDC049900]|uniref:PAS domain-containing protein n=1 Tax=unclassified Micromonospora TaxID=2617518 RepID=UPI0037B25F59